MITGNEASTQEFSVHFPPTVVSSLYFSFTVPREGFFCRPLKKSINGLALYNYLFLNLSPSLLEHDGENGRHKGLKHGTNGGGTRVPSCLVDKISILDSYFPQKIGVKQV